MRTWRNVTQRWSTGAARHGAARAILLAALVAAGAALSACAGTSAASPAAPRPGAELRSLNAVAQDAGHQTFEATYTYTGPVPASPGVSGSATRTVRFTIGQDGSKSRLALDGTVALDEGGEQSFVCVRGSCLADSPMPRVETPPFFYVLRNLVTGNTFWADTQGYPITTADLASRGVAVAISSATYSGRHSTCVTITYRRDPDGQPLVRAHDRSQRWCVDGSGLVDAWSSGRRSLELTTFTASPPASTFQPPAGSRVSFPK